MALGALGQIHISVTDVERSVAFYRDVLGIRHEFTVPGQPMAFLAQRRRSGSTWACRSRPEFTSRCVLYFTVDDIDAEVARAGLALGVDDDRPAPPGTPRRRRGAVDVRPDATPTATTSSSWSRARPARLLTKSFVAAHRLRNRHEPLGQLLRGSLLVSARGSRSAGVGVAGQGGAEPLLLLGAGRDWARSGRPSPRASVAAGRTTAAATRPGRPAASGTGPGRGQQQERQAGADDEQADARQRVLDCRDSSRPHLLGGGR